MAGPLLARGAFFVRIRCAQARHMTDDSKQGRIIGSRFEAATWLKNRHLQTIYPSLPVPRAPRPALTRRTLELPDGDVTVVDGLARPRETPTANPLLVCVSRRYLLNESSVSAE